MNLARAVAPTGRCVIDLVLLSALLLLSASRTVDADELTLPGSGNPQFVLGELAKAFNGQQIAHRVAVPPSTGTAGALRDVAQGTASMGRISRQLTEEERSQGLVYIPVGRDAVVFVAGAAVTVRSVTRAQMLAAYTGKLRDWRELGGKPGPIRAIGRESTDASRQAIQRVIKEFVDIKFGDGVKLVHLDPQLIELLDRFPTSLGFLNRSALYGARTKLVPLALDSVDPTPENVKFGRYPVWLEFGLIYRSGALSDAGHAFVKFIESPAGVQILRDYGVDPLSSRL